METVTLTGTLGTVRGDHGTATRDPGSALARSLHDRTADAGGGSAGRSKVDRLGKLAVSEGRRRGAEGMGRLPRPLLWCLLPGF